MYCFDGTYLLDYGVDYASIDETYEAMAEDAVDEVSLEEKESELFDWIVELTESYSIFLQTENVPFSQR